MSESKPWSTPFVEFIDDYFAECDEHLMSARDSLLALEPCVARGQEDRHYLDELFRSFHSIKGLSAMVGLHDAEQLAHQLENYLSALHKRQTNLGSDGLDALIQGVKALEEVISARRANTSPPDIRGLVGRVSSLIPGPRTVNAVAPESAGNADIEPNSLELSAEQKETISRRIADGARAWRVTFVPTPGLSERGVNVNTVRQRLQEFGELLHATPLVLPGGQIAFAFVVTSRANENVFTQWLEDGLTADAYHVNDPVENPRDDVPESARPAYSSLMPGNVVRVDLARLDELMRMIGELVISRAKLHESLKRLGPGVLPAEQRALQETNLAIERQLRDLREGVMRVRLVPIREVFARMQFVIKDLTREHGKSVTLTLSGQETEIDKFIVERLMDPLLHLVRNAVSHGLEEPDERVAKGKSREGQISLRASATGDMIVIEVEDDGRGIDAQNVLERGRAAGIVDAGIADGPAALLDVLCAPGFSTRAHADRASGRGVGMAVVRSAVEELGGMLSLDTRLGEGTHFTIQLPLTLAIADALIVSVSGQTFAVPQLSVREVLEVDPAKLKVLENNEIMAYRDGVLAVVRLAPFFGLRESDGRNQLALVLGQGRGAVALLVDRVLGLREIVVRPVIDPLIRVPGVAGATELGDGRAVLILDSLLLARAASKQARTVKVKASTGSFTPSPRHDIAETREGTSN